MVEFRRRRPGLLSLIPLMGVVWVVYNVLLVMGMGPGELDRTLLTMSLPSGAAMMLRAGDLLVLLGLVALYVEMLKATRTGTASVIEHSLSMLVFVAFLVEFIIVAGAGTATFLVLALMALLDVIAGFSISISAARRDLSIDRSLD